MARGSFRLPRAHRFGERGQPDKPRILLNRSCDLFEVLEGLWLFEVLMNARDIALGFRVFIGLDDKRAKKMADYRLAQHAGLHEQPKILEEPEILIDLQVAELAAVALI
jgi:hypothetical protein